MNRVAVIKTMAEKNDSSWHIGKLEEWKWNVGISTIKNKVRTGRTMERNHFNLADDEYHLTVLGVIRRPDGRFLITKRVMTKAWAPGWWEVSVVLRRQEKNRKRQCAGKF